MKTKLLESCLDDLETRIDPQAEAKLRKEWVDFSYGRFHGGFFTPQRERHNPARFDWPSVSINAALEDFETMAIQQFGACSNVLAEAKGDLLNVRCNYGTGIMPSLFGLEMFIMEEPMNTLPTIRPLNDLTRIEKLLDAGVPDLQEGYGARVLEMGERFAEWMSPYPAILEFVQVYHPDMQGPMDVCELIYGSTLFTTLYDRPEMVKALLDLICDTYTRFLHAWYAIHPARTEGNCHWGLFHRGGIMLREDSAMNLSAKMVQEFILPYDERLLRTFGGGAIHFCGKGDHHIADLAELDHLYAINLTQPELNNMEHIFQHTVDKGINLLGLQRQAAEEATQRGRSLHGRVHILG